MRGVCQGAAPRAYRAVVELFAFNLDLADGKTAEMSMVRFKEALHSKSVVPNRRSTKYKIIYFNNEMDQDARLSIN